MLRASHIVERNDPPPYYLVLLDESVLIRNIGGRRVLAEQLEKLALLCDRKNVIIRIAPLAESAMTFLGTFILLTLDEGNEILYHEELTSDEVIHTPVQVRRFRERFERLWDRALDPPTSRELIRSRTAELYALLERNAQ